MRRCDGRPKPDERALDAGGVGTVPALRVIRSMLPKDRGQAPAVRRACRYRAATIRVAAGTRVRHPACPRCGERLAYRETAAGALFLRVDDPAFRLTVLDVPR
jgi:predicted RNA-binding Zn-ribbon protein involved in translation (DUF1610 family)